MYYIKLYKTVIKKCSACSGEGARHTWRSKRGYEHPAFCPICRGDGHVKKEIEVKVPISVEPNRRLNIEVLTFKNDNNTDREL